MPAALLEAGAGRVIGIDRDAQALEHARRATGGVARSRRVRARRDYREIGRRACGPRRSRGSTACWPTWECRPCSSTTPSAGSAFGRPGRSTCGWIGRAARRWPRRSADVDERALADVIWRFGEERRSRRVARFDPRGARSRRADRHRRRWPSVVRRGAGGGQLAAHRSGDAHVSGAADLGERTSSTVSRRFSKTALGALAPGGTARGHRVSLAGGPRS